jgi:hypothetical protein
MLNTTPFNMVSLKPSANDIKNVPTANIRNAITMRFDTFFKSKLFIRLFLKELTKIGNSFCPPGALPFRNICSNA